MVKEIISFLENKKVLILGFGREGKSTYNFIRNHLKNQKLYIADMQEDLLDKNEFLKKDSNIECICGKHYLNGLENYDVIIKTPGIAFVNMDITKFKDKIKSQLDLFLEFCNNKTIGITGTKGKSTTSSLIYSVLKNQNKNVLLLGNIGNPIFDYIDEINEDTYIVIEMSSHQLEFTKNSPNISIITNLFPEHLDHYNSYNDYVEAKFNIFKFQTENDHFLYDYDNIELKERIRETKPTQYKVSFNEKDSDIKIENNMIVIKGKEIYDINSPRNLLGEYNLKNIMFVLGVASILNLDMNKVTKTIDEFKTLKHRLEFVGQIDGVKYYDNSIATIPVATEEAIKALKDVDTLIIGGMDRGIDYSEFAEFLDKCDVQNIICMPDTGHKIAKMMKANKCIIVNTLEEAVEEASKKTEKGKSCLLSPAAASYGFFKNFEEKGDKFKEIVLNLKLIRYNK